MSYKPRTTSTGQESKGHLTLCLISSHQPDLGGAWELGEIEERSLERKQQWNKAPPTAGFQA